MSRTPRSPLAFVPPALSALGAALPDLALGAVFLTAWVAPQTFQTNIIPKLMLVMLLEFVIVHSSAFMGAMLLGKQRRAKKVKTIIGLGVFYTLFVAGFALGCKTWWPVWSFWGLMLNRLLGMLLGQAPRGEARQFIQRSWAVSVCCYLGFVFLTTLAPIPALGVTGEFSRGLPGSGLWVNDPQRVIAFGFLYFTAVGISGLFRHRWLRGEPRRGTQPATQTVA